MPMSPFSEEGRKALQTSLSSRQLAELLRSHTNSVRLLPSGTRGHFVQTPCMVMQLHALLAWTCAYAHQIMLSSA